MTELRARYQTRSTALLEGMTFALRHDRPISLARQEINIICTAHRIVRVAVTAEARGADPARSIAPLVRGWCHGRLPLLRRTTHHSERLQWLLAETLDEIADQVTRAGAATALHAAAREIAGSA